MTSEVKRRDVLGNMAERDGKDKEDDEEEEEKEEDAAAYPPE